MIDYAINNEMTEGCDLPPFLTNNPSNKEMSVMAETTITKVCTKNKPKKQKKQFSAEHRRKLSESAKKRWQDPEYRKEMAKVEMSESARAAMSERMKNIWADPEYKKAHIGIKSSEEKKRKISKKTKERWANSEYKARVAKKIGKAAKEVWERPGYREKMSTLAKERLDDPACRKRMSENSKKNWQDPEYRERTLKSREGLQKGENHPMWGRKHSEESRQKMSESHIGIQAGENHPMYGNHHSEEAIQKMIVAHIGISLSEDHKKKIGKASKKTWATIDEDKKNEWRRKIGDGNKGKVVSKEARKKMSKAHKGKRHSPATEFKKGMKHSSEHLEYMSKTMSELWKNPKHIKKMAKALHVTPNKPEAFMLNLLNEIYPGEWKFTGDFSFMINGKSPDFVNCNGKKLIIEFWGDYWHKGEDPKDRANIFKPFGYETLVIWEHELKDVDSVVKRIHEFMVI